ncbi:G patch domain-containing protein 1 isoform X2 [Fundulus heteroclitus]|uniref:G patch domain-containing protein 1 isoform X2 n=1 Tax=Fundulus heteroclitus TaxID=8078 RepID=UPI00165BF4D6|nr:G patch domain-containing protein 1 isoform X2 [Fundulus heteroclitus]
MAAGGDSDEDFVSFGTPLEPLEEDEPLKRPVPLHEQTVKDEKGRYQRFHGAFTGGFSAGYFNTVGSKEGWSPATFVSSRQQKAEKHHARPEDFMDEEDFSEHGIAPREITTSQEFSSSRRDEAAEKARAVSAQAALIPGDTLLEELITPARSSVGIDLLTKMGWKEGQGIGPRLKRKPRRQLKDGGSRKSSYVLPPTGSEESEDEDDEEFAPENVTFAPKDVTPVDFTPRLGVQGLGYRGLDPGRALLGRAADEHVNLFRPQSETRSRLFGERGRSSRRAGVAGQAFGVGALEDEDEDVYHRDSMSRYDTVLGEEEPGDGLYGWTAPEQYTRRRERNKDAAYLGKILEGFTLAQNPLEEKTIFPPPTLPRDYRPVHYFRPKVDVTRLSGVSSALAEALKTSKGHMVPEEPQQGGRHQLDSGQRGALLGEDVLKGPASVLDLLRPDDRQRLLSLRNASAHKPCRSDSQDSSQAPGPGPVLPASGLQQQEALAAWRGSSSSSSSSQSFKPFEKNPSKQARYELYLGGLRQGDTGALEQSLDPSMTEWERSRERDEFVRASILYRPSSSSLSSRFTRGELQEDEDAVEVSRDQEGERDAKQAAVQMKMFGKLTRETLEWHPDRLLCKRFNVPDPYPGSSVVGLPKVKRDKFSVFNFLTVPESRETAAPPQPLEPGKKSRWDVSEQEKEKKDEDPPSQAVSEGEEQSSDKKAEEEEEEEEQRPPMDLFKAIFASSSSEKSSSSSEGESDGEEGDAKEEEGRKEAVKLFSVAASSSSSAVTSSLHSEAAGSSQKSAQDEEEFGPKLPPPLPPAAAAAARGGAAPRYLLPEEEKTSRRSKEKKHKNKKQQKHKKEKKKKKHKKHKHKGKRKKEASGSSSEDSKEDEDDVQPSTDELLRRLKSIRPPQIW